MITHGRRGRWVGIFLEIKWHSMVGCPRTLSMKLVAWTVHREGNVARNLNQLEFFATRVGDKVRVVKFVRAACHCYMSRGFDASWVPTVQVYCSMVFGVFFVGVCWKCLRNVLVLIAKSLLCPWNLRTFEIVTRIFALASAFWNGSIAPLLEEKCF